MPLISSYLLILCALMNSLVSASPITPSRASFPIFKRAGLPLRRRQGSQTGAAGLGDLQDAAYSIEVVMGSKGVPLLIDTGSSDLWSVTSACTSASCGNTTGSTPPISASDFDSTGIDVRLSFGDSSHRTVASGSVASGTVNVAGLQLKDQFIAAVNSTNTSLPASGVFGVGFANPLGGNSVFQSLLKQVLSPPFPNGSRPIDAELTDAFISRLPTEGPFIGRLIADGQLRQPMFTMTLQREDIEEGGNIGQLTIGQLPDGVSNDSLTWVPVRLVTLDQGGLAGSSSNPNETYPARWEIAIDNVLLNGTALPKPNIPNDIGYTALIDSGASILAGPQDVVSSVYSAITIPGSQSSSGSPPEIPCVTPVNLAFVIGGRTFPVDPRDFLSGQNDTQHCKANALVPTDPPKTGALMSWILGSPFIKSNLIVFYFGNLTHPSVDPPRMGFLSTVPSNASGLYHADIQSAQSVGTFVAGTVPAPTATFSATTTNSNGVAQAPTAGATPLKIGQVDGSFVVRVPLVTVSVVMAVLGVFML